MRCPAYYLLQQSICANQAAAKHLRLQPYPRLQVTVKKWCEAELKQIIAKAVSYVQELQDRMPELLTKVIQHRSATHCGC